MSPMLKGSKSDYYSCNIYYLLFTVSYLNHEVETEECALKKELF